MLLHEPNLNMSPYCRFRAGRCACFTLLLAMFLLPVMFAHPIIGFVILFYLLSAKD